MTEVEMNVDLQEKEMHEEGHNSAPVEKESEPEQILTALEKGQKPWFLTTTEVYKIVKGTVKFIPHSAELFDRSLNAIELLTKYVNENTRVQIAFDPEQTHDLVNRLDEILTEQLVIVDDGFDSLRAKFSLSLRNLIDALSRHSQWAKNYAKTQQENAKQAVSLRYQHTPVLMKLLVEQAEIRFPKVSKLVQNSVENGKQIYRGKVPESVQEYAAKVLADAQPFVHQAVNYSRPVVERVVEASQPYYEKSAPYLAPLVERAEQLEASLKENVYVGPYVTKAVDTSYLLFNHIVGYAIPHCETAEAK